MPKLKLDVDKLHEVVDIGNDGKIVLNVDKYSTKSPIEKITFEVKDEYAKYLDWGREIVIAMISFVIGAGLVSVI